MPLKNFLKKLRLAESLFDLHEDAFKAKNYRNWAYQIEQLGDFAPEKADWSALGFSASLLKRWQSFVETGSFPELDEVLEKTPEGILEMLAVKGLGAKKVRILWKDAGITDLETLKNACEKGEIAKIKGFGEKTQTQILENIQFKEAQTGFFRLDTTLQYGNYLLDRLKNFPDVQKADFCGTISRFLPVHERVEILIATQNRKSVFEQLSKTEGISPAEKQKSIFTWQGAFDDNHLPIFVHCSALENFESELLYLSSAAGHLDFAGAKGDTLGKVILRERTLSQKEIYEKVGLPNLLPHLREDKNFIGKALLDRLPDMVEKQDLKGILHAHSLYSDGANTLRDMALACKNAGFSYLGITDHSQSAYYANGLKEHDIIRQHEEADRLNTELEGFRILKGIESDILSDGSLDYPDEVLARFDFVIASVHSALNMSEAKATERIINAVMNPYTNILGHPTGRLLLKREGYPLDMHAVIDACAEFGTAIEINTNPHRLDLDWRYLHYALEKGVKIVLAPDAHNTQDIEHYLYGVHIGKKAALSKNMCLNCLETDEILKYFRMKKQFA
jgi:DNA polymerase (family 10)